ncbi:MAG: hypothetical protein QXH03_02900 [Candidatus Bathyarchaeia archaeon]
MKVDVVFSLEDFKALAGLYKDKNHVRICIEEKPIGDVSSRHTIWLSTAMPDKILKCNVATAYFNRIFLQSPIENDEKKRYNEWVETNYKKVEEALGFKPIEGYWTTTKEED